MWYEMKIDKQHYGNLTKDSIWEEITTIRAKIISLLQDDKISSLKTVSVLKEMKKNFSNHIFQELLTRDEKTKDIWGKFVSKNSDVIIKYYRWKEKEGVKL
jgi:predicted nucleic acid-binding protein